MTQKLIELYSTYTSKELYEIKLNIFKYSTDAKKAVDIVAENRGGWHIIEAEVEKEKEIENEIKRVAKEVKDLSMEYTDVEFLKRYIKSDILSPHLLNSVIKEVSENNQREVKDKEINERTIIGSILGISAGSILGGVVWGLQLITMGRMFIILVIFVGLLNYGAIRIITKQSKKNIVVIVSVIIGTIISLWIGSLLYNYFGYQGANFKLI